MTATEKLSLYNLIKISSDFTLGFSDSDFPENAPNFTDDVENQNEIKTENNLNNSNFTDSNSIEENDKNFAENSNNRNEINSLTALAQKILACNRCQLCKTRTKVVPGEGVKNPAVLIIGEGPGEDEDATGRPFVGAAGQLLDKMLASISLDRRKNCFIANIVKCRPPHNRDPLPEEANACEAFLQAQITILKPKMILCMGRIASQNLLKTSTGINRLRGQFYDFQGITTLCTYHPSALLRNADLKRPAWEDLKMFRAKLETIVPNYAQIQG